MVEADQLAGHGGVKQTAQQQAVEQGGFADTDDPFEKDDEQNGKGQQKAEPEQGQRPHGGKSDLAEEQGRAAQGYHHDQQYFRVFFVHRSLLLTS